MLRKAITSLVMPLLVTKGKMSLRKMEKTSFYPFDDNKKLLKKIIQKNKNTEYGKKYNFDKIHSVEDFQKKVPVTTYEDYSPYIERLKNNEKNLLTKAKVIGYSRTSGSSGTPKFIPATMDSLYAYMNYTWTRALAAVSLDLKAKGLHYKSGRGLYSLPSVDERLPNGLLCSNIAEIGAKQFGFIYPYILTLPWGKMFKIEDGDFRYCIYRFALEDEDTSFTFSVFLSTLAGQIEYLKENWKQLVDDIEKGVISDISKLEPELKAKLTKRTHPNPKRAAYLRSQFEKGFDETILERLWPNLQLICGIGTASFQGATVHLKKYAKNVPFDFSIYGASEGLVAACYETNNTDMQLLTDSCFFEFIPEEGNENKILTLDKLEIGKHYEIVITTQAGLYRYRLKDIVEVTGYRNKCPIISFVYRKGQLLNVSGEKFSEENARNAISTFENKFNIELKNWIFSEDDSVMPSRYAVLIESDVDLPKNCEKELERIVGECNHRYIFQKEKHDLGDLIIKKLKPNTHEEWKEFCVSKGAFGEQTKPVHTLDNETKREFFLSHCEE